MSDNITPPTIEAEEARAENAQQASQPCTFDPRDTPLEVSMFHCPHCGEMVIAGLPHPNYALITENIEEMQQQERAARKPKIKDLPDDDADDPGHTDADAPKPEPPGKDWSFVLHVNSLGEPWNTILTDHRGVGIVASRFMYICDPQRGSNWAVVWLPSPRIDKLIVHDEDLLIAPEHIDERQAAKVLRRVVRFEVYEMLKRVLQGPLMSYRMKLFAGDDPNLQPDIEEKVRGLLGDVHSGAYDREFDNLTQLDVRYKTDPTEPPLTEVTYLPKEQIQMRFIDGVWQEVADSAETMDAEKIGWLTTCCSALAGEIQKLREANELLKYQAADWEAAYNGVVAVMEAGQPDPEPQPVKDLMVVAVADMTPEPSRTYKSEMRDNPPAQVPGGGSKPNGPQ